MARKKSTDLTDAELRLMEVLWKSSPATVTDVLAGLPGDPPLAYSTVITTLRILETKGFVEHQKNGRAFTYQPLIGRQEARSGALTRMLQRFFEGSPEQLMASLFEGRRISAAELKRLRKLVEEHPEKKR
jgi:predicted transcriptional regulator